MKKNLLCREKRRQKLLFSRQFVLISALFLIGLALPDAINAQTLQQRISLEMKDVTLEQVLVYIGNTTPYEFFYRREDISSMPKKDYSFNNATITEVMNKLTEGVDLQWTNRNGLISIVNRKGVSINGYVQSEQQNKKIPVAYAVVHFPEIGVGAIADATGYYHVPKISQGTYKVKVSCLGYETLETTLEIIGNRNNLNFLLEKTSFFIKNVVVTAQASKAGASTSSVISRSAMDHMQPSSLSDVMSLLPGQTPNTARYMMNSATFGVRGGGSLGTVVIMDGVPLSNNTNLQMMTSAIGGSLPSGAGNTPSEGLDLRTIGTDGLSSVEVIQGVASPEYGDILTGAIIVNSKTGIEPLKLNFQTNQYMYGGSLSHGVALGKDGRYGNLNYSFDYVNNNREPREGQDAFQRVNGRIRYGQTFGRLNTQTSFNYVLSRDNQAPSNQDTLDYQTVKRRDWELRFSHEGTYDISSGWLKNLKYTAAFSYKNRYNYFEDEVSNASTAYSMSKTDGAVLTDSIGLNIPGITNISTEESNYKAWILPSSYRSVYRLYGEEYYTYLKVNLNFAGNIGTTHHRIIVGGEYTNEGNKGKGKVFDPDTPPWRNLSYDFSSQRERSFNDIPFINRYALYVSENMTYGRLRVTAGLRYDYLCGFGDKVTPRLNASLELIKDKLNIRGGYGKSAKLPTLSYLYPDNAYFDLVNFNNHSVSNIDEQQKFQVITTRIFETKNHNLKMATNEKSEVGFDLDINKMKFSVTGYSEKSKNSYSFSVMPDTYKIVDYITYKGPNKAADYPTDPAVLPTLEVDNEYKVLVKYSRPENNNAYHNKGVEFTFDFGRWDAIRTSFLLNGLYRHHKSYSNGYYYWYSSKDLTSGKYDTYPHVGVWDSKDVETSGYGVNYGESFRTNLLLTHNIPKLGFVITATATVLWAEKGWREFKEETLAFPKYYIDITTGEFKPFTASMQEDPEFAALDRTDYLSKTRDERERTWSPIMAISLNVTKEFRDRMRVSFYAHNMFNSIHWHRNNVTYDREKRSAQDFSFGLKLTAIIK